MYRHNTLSFWSVCPGADIRSETVALVFHHGCKLLPFQTGRSRRRPTSHPTRKKPSSSSNSSPPPRAVRASLREDSSRTTKTRDMCQPGPETSSVCNQNNAMLKTSEHMQIEGQKKSKAGAEGGGMCDCFVSSVTCVNVSACISRR